MVDCKTVPQRGRQEKAAGLIAGLVNADNLVKPHNNLVNCLMRGAAEGLCWSGGGGDKAVGSSGQHSSRRMNEPATFWSAFIPDRPSPPPPLGIHRLGAIYSTSQLAELVLLFVG